MPAWARPILRAGGIKGPGALPYPRLPEGTETMPQIDHIVVVMMPTMAERLGMDERVAQR